MLRVQNNKDFMDTKIELFSLTENISTFLTSYYGNNVKFQKVE